MQTTERDTVRADYAALVQEEPLAFRLSPRVYWDAQLFELELERVFEQGWVYVAHTSELPQRGDFRTATIGRQPVIVAHGQDGQLRVLLNACRHRGSTVCRVERGNTRAFRCSYHGWSYSTTGALVGIPQRDGYPQGFGSDISGLLPVPRVAVHRSLIFASLAATGASLDEHLGAVKRYVDYWADMSPDGELVLHTPHQYTFAGNWKLQAENGCDAYHPNYLHESAYATMDRFGVRPLVQSRDLNERGCTRGFEGGHGILEGGAVAPVSAAQQEEYWQTLVRRYGPAHARAVNTRRHVYVYPNLCLMNGNLRVIQPLAVDRTDVRHYFTAMQGVPEALNRERLRDMQYRIGTAGFVGPDDAEVFAECQTGVQARALQWLHLSRGMQREELHPSGERVGHTTDETPQRALYRAWARQLAAAAP